jgi:hypothetical protein
MSETNKQTPVEKFFAELQAHADERAEARGRVSALREVLIMLLRDVSKDPPEWTLMFIRGCQDEDQLKAAILRTRKLTSIDQFQF